MKIGLLGCGLIGKKRSAQLGAHQLVDVYDPDQGRAQNLAQEFGGVIHQNLDSFFEKTTAEIVMIAAFNCELAPLTMRALHRGCHVLVEKPAALTLKEIRQMQDLSQQKKLAVKVGFNHRFHPAMLKAQELIQNNQLGELMFMRVRYGHGGRLGYEKEWRARPTVSGGGELMDQGVHILDLVHWWFGPMPLQSSFVTTSFWNMAVDDNAVLTLAQGKKWATFHVSCSEWKNLFSLEIYGRTGKILIQGLGGSYGPESLTYYKMLPEMGPPQIETFDYSGIDESWGRDLKNLVDHIKTGAPLWGDLNSAGYALEQVKKAYTANGYGELTL